MAIEGKKAYKIYLTESETDILRDFLETTKFKGGLSGWLDDVICRTTNVLRETGIIKDRGKVKLSRAKLLRFMIAGVSKDL